MADGVSWTALILVIIVIIVLIIFIVLGFTHRNELTAFGIAFVIQDGVSSGTTDIMTLDGNKMYIGQSSSTLTLTLNKSGNHLKGRVVGIKNNSGNPMTLIAGTINLNNGRLNNTVSSGQLALLMATDDTESWLRLQ